MSQIDCFTNDKFSVLAHLYDVRGSDNKARITQQEIADYLDLSRATINKIMRELKEEGYVELDGVHVGRYVLMDKAMTVIRMFRGLEAN